MSRFILAFSFVALSFLFFCSIFAPASAAIWLASTAAGYQVVRVLLMIFLIAMLVSDPPRYVWFRTLTGVVSISLAAWALGSTYQNQMQILDTASVLIASISMAIEALEFRPEPSNEIPLKHHAKKLRTKAA